MSERLASRDDGLGRLITMRLVPALAASTSDGLIQATRSVCGPFLDLAPMSGVQYRRPWAEQCIRFNQSVIDYLSANQTVKIVVLSSSLAQYVPGGEAIPWRALVKTADGFNEIEPNLESLRTSVVRTEVDALHQIGKRVVLIAPPPSADFDIGRCLGRKKFRQANNLAAIALRIARSLVSQGARINSRVSRAIFRNRASSR